MATDVRPLDHLESLAVAGGHRPRRAKAWDWAAGLVLALVIAVAVGTGVAHLVSIQSSSTDAAKSSASAAKSSASAANSSSAALSISQLNAAELIRHSSTLAAIHAAQGVSQTILVELRAQVASERQQIKRLNRQIAEFAAGEQALCQQFHVSCPAIQ